MTGTCGRTFRTEGFYGEHLAAILCGDKERAKLFRNADRQYSKAMSGAEKLPHPARLIAMRQAKTQWQDQYKSARIEQEEAEGMR